MHAVSLCSGYGGLDLAVERALGATTVLHVEHDAAPSRILAARWPTVPNLGDVKTLEWAQTPAAVVAAGYPCQPFSHAGLRRGVDDERHLWPFMAQGIEQQRPEWLALENVRGHLKLGWSLVVADLDRLRYDVRWVLTLAADVGAPHNRARLFALAHDRDRGGFPAPEEPFVARTQPDGSWLQPGTLFGVPYVQRPPAHGSQVDGWVYTRRAPRRAARLAPLLPTPAVNDMGAGKTVQRWDEWTAAMKAKHGNGNGHGPSLAIELLRASERYAPAVAAWEAATRPAPPALVDGQPSVEFVEWMMGLPAGWVTDPAVWEGVKPTVARSAQLKALGNGVVPQQALAALDTLLMG